MESVHIAKLVVSSWALPGIANIKMRTMQARAVGTERILSKNVQSGVEPILPFLTTIGVRACWLVASSLERSGMLCYKRVNIHACGVAFQASS
jgi:hypothetical protein